MSIYTESTFWDLDLDIEFNIIYIVYMRIL